MQRIVMLLLFVAGAVSLRAQRAPLVIPPLSLGITLDVGMPTMDLRDNLDRNGIGGSINFLLALRNSPLRVGIDLGYMGYERQSLAYRTVAGGFVRDFLLETNVGLLHGHATLRYMFPLGGAINPYLDGIIGTKYFLASSRLYEDIGFELIPVDGFTDQDDWALSYGAALGAELRLFRDPAVAIDLRVTYMLGSQATYLVRRNPPPNNIQDPADFFEERSSATHLLVPRIGIQFDLSAQNKQQAPTGRDPRRRR